ERAESNQRQRIGDNDAEKDDQRILQRPGQDDGAAALDDLADIHLQSNDEEEEDEAQLGDGVDVGGVGDQFQGQGTGDDTGDDISGNCREFYAREKDGEQ